MVDGAYYKFHKTSFLFGCNNNTVSEFEDSYTDKDGNESYKKISPYSPIKIPDGSNFSVAANRFCK